MAHDKTLDQLDRLIDINKNAEAGLLSAAESVKNSELETLFSGYAQQHGKFASELQDEVSRLGGSSSASGTLGGSLHRGWMDLKSAFSGGGAPGILKSCESGEESAEIAYLNAVAANITGQPHTLIQKHLQQIQGFRTRLARLVGETKDGVTFQKNE